MILMKNGIKDWNKSNSDLFNHYLMDYIMFHVFYAIRKHYKVFCLFKGWHLHLQNGTKVLIWYKWDLCRLSIWDWYRIKSINSLDILLACGFTGWSWFNVASWSILQERQIYHSTKFMIFWMKYHKIMVWHFSLKKSDLTLINVFDYFVVSNIYKREIRDIVSKKSYFCLVSQWLN